MSGSIPISDGEECRRYRICCISGGGLLLSHMYQIPTVSFFVKLTSIQIPCYVACAAVFAVERKWHTDQIPPYLVSMGQIAPCSILEKLSFEHGALPAVSEYLHARMCIVSISLSREITLHMLHLVKWCQMSKVEITFCIIPIVKLHFGLYFNRVSTIVLPMQLYRFAMLKVSFHCQRFIVDIMGEAVISNRGDKVKCFYKLLEVWIHMLCMWTARLV